MRLDLAYRIMWMLVYHSLFRWIPPPFHKPRIFILRLFGADISWKCFIYPNVSVWSPRNLVMKKGGTLGPRVICYNPGLISIGVNTTISQGTHLCSGTHDVARERVLTSPAMPLITQPIEIKDYCWITADVFIGPGVTIADGVVVAARSVVTKSLEPFCVYAGCPAKKTGRSLEPTGDINV